MIPRTRSLLLSVGILGMVAGCDMNDANGSGRDQVNGTVAFQPRIQAAKGALEPVDSVHIRLRLDQATNVAPFVALDLAWNADSATITGLPLKRKWFLEVFGTTGKDTVWYGSDTGTVGGASGTVDLVNSPTVVVREFVPAPQAYNKGRLLANGAVVNLGDTVFLKAPPGAGLSVGTDGIAPPCNPADTGVQRLIMVEPGSYLVTMVACAEDLWNSKVVDMAWQAQYRDSITLLSKLDTLIGTWRSWSTQVSMAASNGLSISWKAAVSATASVPAQADWQGLDASSEPEIQGSVIDSGAVKRLLAPILTSEDSVGRILVKAWAKRNGVAADSIRFWWKVRYPSIRPPIVSHERGYAQVRFSWVPVPGLECRAWSEISGRWTLVSPTVQHGADEFLATGLAPGEWVRFKLIVSDPVSGRVSDTVMDSASSRNPPPSPKFTVVNSNADSAYATLSLMNDPNAIEGVVWSIAYGPEYSDSLSFTQAGDLANRPWVQQVGQGSFVFALKATRDDSSIVDTQRCIVTGFAGNRPQMPRNLRLVRRTTDSLLWEWTANPERAYIVYWGNDRGQILSENAKATLAPGTGRFGRKLSSNDSCWIAVFAMPGGDSLAGLSIGAYSGIFRPRSVPDSVDGFVSSIQFGADWKPRISASWIGRPGYRYVVYDSDAPIDTTELGQERLEWVPADTARSEREISIRALNADSVLSEPVRRKLMIPKIRGIDSRNWFPWVGRRAVYLELVAAPSDVPDSVRFVMSWGSDGNLVDTVMEFPAVGSPLSFRYNPDLLKARPVQGIQYVWSNGDRSAVVDLALDFRPPSLGMVFDVGSAASGDTVRVETSRAPTGWSLSYSIHTLERGWEPTSASGTYGTGADSIRWKLVRDNSTEFVDTTISAFARIDHRKMLTVTYRDGSTGRIWTTRIEGRIWMSTNLDYDIPGDTLDKCFSVDPSKCAAEGRRYSASQIYGLAGGGYCDTVDWTEVPPGTCDRVEPQGGICPVGWRLPTSRDWESLGETLRDNPRSTFRTGKWPGVAEELVDPFGLDVAWPSWCFRQLDRSGCFDSTMGSVYPASDESIAGTIAGAYFDDGQASPDFAAMIGYYNADDTPKTRSYLPVRCVKE